MDADFLPTPYDLQSAFMIMGWVQTKRGCLDPDEQARADAGEPWAIDWCAIEIWASWREDGTLMEEMLVAGWPYDQSGCDNAWRPSTYLPHALKLVAVFEKKGLEWHAGWNGANYFAVVDNILYNAKTLPEAITAAACQAASISPKFRETI